MMDESKKLAFVRFATNVLAPLAEKKHRFQNPRCQFYPKLKQAQFLSAIFQQSETTRTGFNLVMGTVPVFIRWSTCIL